jgi:hypothetical protein
MIYFVYLLLAPINLLLTLFAIVLAPVLPVFAVDKEWWLDNHSKHGIGSVLPSWLNWFNTPDNDLYGDATFQAINGINYWAKVKWIWRNPAYSFGIKYLNYPYVGKVLGDKTIRDNDNAKAGWCFVRANGLFLFRYILRVPFTSTCILGNMGWNIMGTMDDNVQPKPLVWQATFAFTPIRKSGFR